MSSKPAVSVIIPAYNVAPYIGETLDSLIAQTRGDWEAVVVNDGSTDALGDVLARYAHDPRIRVIDQANTGLAGARNRGIAEARADVIALLDGDDRYHPTYLDTMLAALGSDPGLGFVFCDAIMFGTPSREGRRFSEFEPQDGPVTLIRVILRQINIFGSTTIRRAALDEVGGFDARLRAGEDLDLWLRILAAGHGAARVEAALVDYRRRADSLSAAPIKLSEAAVAVYDRLAATLAGRPEQAAALAQAAYYRAVIDWVSGETAIRDGRAREGVRLMAAAAPRLGYRRWVPVLALLARVPALAAPLLRLRARHNAKALALGETA